MRVCPECHRQYDDTVQFCIVDAAKLMIVGGPDEDPLVNQVIGGKYRVEKKIGEGGMGKIYLGRHVTLGKRFAIKTLHADFTRNQEALERFRREAITTAQLEHPNILGMSDMDQMDDGTAYIVMEFLDGKELRSTLAEAPILPLPRVVHVFAQVCRALAAAHDKGIVHRDMKPENVFLVEREGDPDFVKVLDFGIARVRAAGSKLTQTGMVIGTPHYMSPEQARGDASLDHRSDIYTVGVMLYEALTGALPVQADNPTGVLVKILTEEPAPPRAVNPTVTPEVEAVILRAMAKDRNQRFASCRELSLALQQAAGIADASATAYAAAAAAGMPPGFRPPTRMTPGGTRPPQVAPGGYGVPPTAQAAAAAGYAAPPPGAPPMATAPAGMTPRGTVPAAMATPGGTVPAGMYTPGGTASAGMMTPGGMVPAGVMPPGMMPPAGMMTPGGAVPQGMAPGFPPPGMQYPSASTPAVAYPQKTPTVGTPVVVPGRSKAPLFVTLGVLVAAGAAAAVYWFALREEGSAGGGSGKPPSPPSGPEAGVVLASADTGLRAEAAAAEAAAVDAVARVEAAADAGTTVAAAEPGPDAGPDVAVVAAADVAEPAPVDAGPPPAVAITFVTRPEGAKVFLVKEDGTEEELCTTNCQREFPKGQGEIRVRFRRSAYEAEERTFPLTGNTLVDVDLQRSSGPRRDAGRPDAGPPPDAGRPDVRAVTPPDAIIVRRDGGGPVPPRDAVIIIRPGADVRQLDTRGPRIW